MTILVVAFIFLVALLFGAAVYLARVAYHPKTKSYDETFQMEVERDGFERDFFERLDKRDFYIDSDYGYKLHAIWIPYETSRKTVVFVHGYTYTLFGSIKYIEMFMKRGYNILVYDHRFHGKSGGKDCSMGYYERHDLKKVVDWVKRETGDGSIVGTHGESMGAATALLHAEIDNRVSFVVADCPYQSVRDQFKYRLKVEYRLPGFPILNLSSLISKLMIGAFFGEISPLESVKKLDCPVLFIHGDSDAYIPKEHSINMYNAKKGKKALYLTPGADHARSYVTDKAEYERRVFDFVDSVDTQGVGK
jgi:hypothetical protein